MVEAGRWPGCHRVGPRERPNVPRRPARPKCLPTGPTLLIHLKVARRVRP